MNACTLWKLFFEKHLILDVKTTLRLQKPHCGNFWWKHIKNESCKCYLGNKEQKAMFLVVSWSEVHFSFERTFFCVPDGGHPKNRAPGRKFVQPFYRNLLNNRGYLLYLKLTSRSVLLILDPLFWRNPSITSLNLTIIIKKNLIWLLKEVI